MNEKEQAFINTWQKYHERGKAAYMAGYALIYAVITLAITIMFRWGDAPVKDLLLSQEFLTKLVLFTLIGLILANFKWKSNENKYSDIKSKARQSC
ncbi:putative membrane channel-forming protein YqfA (hemolysin III family) [Pontibacter aydingkolensis]|uniref:Uncharacterized protein n=1 Tax=Pontibacter aydingkolensis TaxID=1911536 RepID=A0ABS7CP60_9BACT|nr:hypothetical protein [Pontibacter aydingkolensis]MBW7465632.1 hypothetical protein [Pontibacter aydingkolensis]